MRRLLSLASVALAVLALAGLAGAAPSIPTGGGPIALSTLGADSSGDPTWAAYAHARLALEARARGDEGAAGIELNRAMQLDPQWASPHFSMAWHNLQTDPGSAPSELLLGMKLWMDSFPNQNMLAFHLVLWSILALFLAIVGLALSAVLLALPETHHRATESLGRYMEPSYASVIASLLLALPFALGAGFILPLLFLLALQQPLLRGAGKRAWALLLAVTLAMPWMIRETDALLLPRTPESWVGRVSVASRARWNPELATALRETEAQAPGRHEIPFARGLMSLRDGRFEEALGLLRRADSLSHGDARVLNDLGIASWMLGRGFSAESSFTSATQADERLTAAHYNLAQVLARRLAFEDANREMLRAGALDFDRLRRHFDANGAGRSAMMIEEPSTASLWQLWRDETTVRADWTESPGWLRRFWESRTALFAMVAFAVLLLGSYLGRRLRRWLPVQTCANCRTLLCRRCSGRRKGETVCQVCLGHLSSTGGGPFGRVLLERRRNQVRQERGMIQLAMTLLLPPMGRALEGRWVLAAFEWFGFSLLALATVRGGFWLHPGPNLNAGLNSIPSMAWIIALWLAWWLPLAVREALRHRRNNEPGAVEAPSSMQEAA